MAPNSRRPVWPCAALSCCVCAPVQVTPEWETEARKGHAHLLASERQRKGPERSCPQPPIDQAPCLLGAAPVSLGASEGRGGTRSSKWEQALHTHAGQNTGPS